MNALSDLIGKTLLAIYYDTERIAFQYGLNDFLEVGAYGDCCSESWIESIDAIPGAVGSKIISVFDDDIGEVPSSQHECLRCYKTIIRTLKGDITIDYRNSSNGYYGGSLEVVFGNSKPLPKNVIALNPNYVMKELV